MMKQNKIYFEAPILQHSNINAAYIEFPFSVEKLFGKKGQIKVKAIFNNIVEYRGSLVKMGGNHHKLGLTKDIRKKLQKGFGDKIKVEISQDLEERLVEIPEDIQALFSQNKDIEQIFLSSSYTKRKELIHWINEAKKPETRERRKQQILEKLTQKNIKVN